MSKKKVILSTIALLVVMFVAVSAVSYSIANKGHGDKIEQSSLTNLGADASTSYVTNIDLIIENAVKNNETFNVVEIYPTGVEPSDLSKYVSSNGFADYVITANKSTATDDMPKDMVSYRALSVSSATTLSDVVDATEGLTFQNIIDKADLIYFSSPTYTSYNGANNISEDVYNYLHLYSASKPLIMDFVTSSSGGAETKTMGDLVNSISRNHMKFRTFSWTEGLDPIKFFNSDGSYYITYGTKDRTATGNILVLANTATPGAGSMMKAMQDAGDEAIIKAAYYGMSSTLPTKLNYTVKNIGATALTEADLETAYDFIIIEKDVKAVSITDSVYKKLRGLSESSKYILYASSLAEKVSYTSSSNNYLKLMQLLISNKGVAFKNNVLPIEYGFFTSLYEQGKDGKEGAKLIADLINGTVYRNTNITGEASRKFRVLEIQPCYPIDLELAKEQKSTTKYPAESGITGGYYTDPSQVLYGVTKDEVEEGTEYYDFEFSKAKISYATGIPFNQIEVEAMSSNELISSKEVVLESYDLVYIGGNTSAIIPYRSINYDGADFNWQADKMDDLLAGFTAFDMYTHTGAFVNYVYNTWAPLTFNRIGEPNVKGEEDWVELSGNDLTVTKRKQLENYVDSGLPIIIDKAVSDAFVESYNCKNRLEQLALHNIDPDSNMYKFLEYTYKKVDKKTANNVGWGIVDAATDETTVDNSEREYGNTLGSTVTVYDKDCSDKIKQLVDSTKETRPKLSVSVSPQQYIEGDSSTTNTSRIAEFTAGVNVNSTGDNESTASTYTVSLYIDFNDDGMYSDDEEVDSTSCVSGKTVDFKYELDERFFGLLNWKIKATAPDGILCDAKTGNSFFDLVEKEGSPKVLEYATRVLQIMPLDESDEMHIKDGHSLYFCTECQLASRLLKNNVSMTTNVGAFEEFKAATTDDETIWDGKVTVGKHEHDFGIVKYDVNLSGGDTIGSDNWETNFADELTHGDNPDTENSVEFAEGYGDFDFDLDIVTIDQFKKMCEDAASITDEEIDTAIEIKNAKLREYQSDYEALVYNDAGGLKSELEKQLFIAADDLRKSTQSRKYRQIILEGIGTADAPGQWIQDHEYYKFWQYYTQGATYQTNDISNFDALCTAYDAYRKAYDDVIAKKEQYKSNLHQTGNADTWLFNSYDVVILGFADEFNSKDLGTLECDQIKAYLKHGGVVINTHDTITAKENGAPNMSRELREIFGMDRFHVVDYGESNQLSVSASAQYKSPATKTIRIENAGAWSGADVPIKNKDVLVYITNNYGTLSVTYEETGDEKPIDEPIKVTCFLEGGNGADQQMPLKYVDNGVKTEINHTTLDGKVVFEEFYVEQAYDTTTVTGNGALTLGESNVDCKLDIKDGAFTSSSATTELPSDGTLMVNVTVTNGDEVVPDGTSVTVDYRGNTQTAVTKDGKVTFNVNPEQAATKSILERPTGCKYRRYNTSDNSKYFWTERLQAASEADYAKVIADTGIGTYVQYNAPVGLTNLFASATSEVVPTSPYRYAKAHSEAFEQYSNVDGWTYEAKYGTRRAQKVNAGGVTAFPFAISDELLIAPTHAQSFALDLEDDNVAVWYTLAGTTIDEGLGITQQFAHYVSSYFTASPRDGMNYYYMYSKACGKGKVFYTGAGHTLVTGRNKDNNDERRLFINMIVNCVKGGNASPKLNLYNKCDESGDSHENCDDLYVNPKDKDENDKLAKNLNTLFYNESIKMYQYNIDESQTEIYPEFDFKAIAGSAEITELQVFYDLDYGTGEGMDQYDTYVNDPDHVLITSYDRKDQVDGERKRLRQTAFPDTLKIKEEYFSKNQNCTYIVILVQDEKGKSTSARVKINVIPHLFDLTDATTDSQNVLTNISVVDGYHKNKYNV